jgi:hypothetical protein
MLQCRRSSPGRGRPGPDDQPATGRQPVQAPSNQVPQPSSHRVTCHRPTHRAAHHEPDLSRSSRVRPGSKVHDEERAARPHPAPHGALELSGTSQPMRGRQHPDSSRARDAIRRTTAHGPCGAAQRRSRDPLGYACAAGNHASSPGGGCWAGRCASRCRLQTYLAGAVSHRPTVARARAHLAHSGTHGFVGPIHGTRRAHAGSNWAPAPPGGPPRQDRNRPPLQRTPHFAGSDTPGDPKNLHGPVAVPPWTC